MAVIHISCASPECAETPFDGWYFDCPDTIEEIFEIFKKRYPEADVFIVKREASAWRQMHKSLPDGIYDKLLDTHNARCIEAHRARYSPLAPSAVARASSPILLAILFFFN